MVVKVLELNEQSAFIVSLSWNHVRPIWLLPES